MAYGVSRVWTDAEIERLRALSAQGASVLRAAAALNRKTAAVAKIARLHGLVLVGSRRAKAAIRELDKRHPRSP